MASTWIGPMSLMANAIRSPDDLEDYCGLLTVLHGGRQTEVSSARLWEVTSNNNLLIVREKKDDKDTVGGRMVGMLTFVSYSISEGRVGLIQEVAVRRDFERQGIVSTLTDAAIDWARGLRCVRVELPSSRKRQAVRRLYAGKGFVRYDTGVFRLKL